MIKNIVSSTPMYAVVVTVDVVAALVVREIGRSGLEAALITTCLVPFTALQLSRLGVSRWVSVLMALPPFVPVLAALVIVSRPGRKRSGVSPRQRFWAAACATVSIAAVGSAFVALATFTGEYGWTLFVAFPFAVGVTAAVTTGIITEGSVSGWYVIGVAQTALIALAVGLLLLTLEGVICLVMATPLATVLAALGAATTMKVMRYRVVGGLHELGAVLLVLPAMLAAEGSGRSAPPTAVTTAVEIDAPPSVVWRHVIEFDRLPAEREAVLRTGIAYPIGATIEGHGVGAVRRCHFSTGDFVEPITVWDEPRLLAFDVASQPRPMDELSPYGAVHAPHLDGFLRSERGEFRLIPLPGGRTRLVGTTVYRNRMWPQAYWRRWSDPIIHAIHLRVLRHVKTEAEAWGAEQYRHALPYVR